MPHYTDCRGGSPFNRRHLHQHPPCQSPGSLLLPSDPPFRSFRSIGEISVKLVPILIVGLGVSFTFQAKLSNLGGEGQICLGAIGMTVVGISPFARAMGPAWIFPGLLVAALSGALWAGIAGFFKTQFKASEIITTLLLNYIAVQFLSYCVYYPLRDSKGNIPQSAKVASPFPSCLKVPG